MLSKALQEAINEQIKNELYSAYLYLSMSAYCEANNLPGSARWMRLQSQEEQKVTGLINRLYELAVKENDYPTQIELQWFITEQVEEEKSASDVVELMKAIGDHGPSLIMADSQLGARQG
jgi:ferritin